MQGTKRPYGEMTEITGSTAPHIMTMFEGFKTEIDENHAARERIIKASRDVTALSKKAIFSLQRIRAVQADLPPKIANEVKERLTAISELFRTMSKDLQGINAWRYQRQASGGIQEFMEAISFEHYLRTGKLITIEESQAAIISGIPLTADDYALGLFDLTGEMMRFSITAIATTGTLPTPKSPSSSFGRQTILTDLRDMRTAFEALDVTSCGNQGLGRDFEKKKDVMRQSVEKVERAACELAIKRSDRPQGWVPGVSMANPSTMEVY